MNIPLPVLSAIETALNTWLKLDGESLPKCEALEGKIIRLHITGLDLNLFFLRGNSIEHYQCLIFALTFFY